MPATGTKKTLPGGRRRGFAESPERFAFAAASKARFEAVMEAAERSGLLQEKSGRISGRISPALLAQAKKQTGIERDSDLIEFALATVALRDDFPEVFRRSRGKVDANLKLGY